VANTWINNIKVTGLRELPQRRMYLADAEVSLYIDHIKTARNFYLCARLLDDYEPATIAIDLSVNGVQKKTCRLTEGRVINVGIIDPLIFPNAKNHLKAEFYFIDNHGMALKLAPNVMLISHFVVDDEVVRPI